MTVYTLNPAQIQDDIYTWTIGDTLDIPTTKGFPYSLIHDTLTDGEPDEQNEEEPTTLSALIEMHTPYIARDMCIFLLRLTFDTDTNVIGAVYRIDNHASTCTWTITPENSQQLQELISNQNPQNQWATKQ